MTDRKITTIEIKATEQWINERIADAELVRDIVISAQELAVAHVKLLRTLGVELPAYALKAGNGKRSADRLYGTIESFRVVREELDEETITTGDHVGTI